MTPFTVAKRMLPYIGVLSFDPAVNASTAGKRAIDDGDVQFCVDCMMGAAEEMFAEGPAALSETDYGDVLRAPLGVTFTTTQYSATIAAFGAFAAYMVGCTVRISGD